MQRIRASALWRSSLLRFFATYCLIALLIIVLLGGALSLLFSGLMVREMTDAGVSILAQLQKAQEFMLRAVERSNQEILLDPWIAGAMDYYEPRVMSVLQRIVTKITAVPIMDDSIWSLCVYYIDEGIVLSSDSSFQTLDMYGDADFLRALQADGGFRGNAYVRYAAKPGPDPSARVISFVSQYPFNRRKSPTMLLVVNIRASYIDDMIDLIHAADDGGLILCDAKGERISSAGIALTEADHLALVAGMDGYVPGQAYDFTRANGTALRVMRFESGMYGWQYLYVLPMDSMTAKRAEVLGLASVFCVLALIGGMLASLALSRRAVKPLRRLSDIVHEPPPGGTPYVDMQRITDSVASLVQESKSAKAVLTEYWMSQRSLFLRELTLGNLRAGSDLQAQMAQYGVDLEMDADFAVFCIAMNGYGPYLDAYSPADKNLHRIMEHEELLSCVAEGWSAYCVDMRDNEKVLVCQVPEDAAPDGAENGGFRLALAAALATALEERLHFHYTVGASRIRHGLPDVPNGYLEASFALADRAIWSGQKAILYDWFVYPQTDRPVYPSQQEKELLHALRAGDRQRAMDALVLFHEQLEGGLSVGGAALRNDYIRLFFAMMQIVYDLSPALHIDDSASIETFSALYHVDTPVQYTAVLAERIDRLLLMMESQNKHKQDQLIQRVMHHIDTNLAADLSATTLAALFYMSPTGLRRLFKENTGMTLKEYSLQARMDHAAALLCQNMPVHQVAEAVGYASPQAFINAFKQAKGVSPTQYRRSSLGT